MRNEEQYVTITHYKEREFYFLNYAIQTEDGFIPKEMEQFHESEKSKFIDRIKELQDRYPNSHVVSISLAIKQVLTHTRVNNPNKLIANIFKDNYIVQENDLPYDIPITLYFSPFAILYEQYKGILTDKLILLIGYFDRKLFMMFTTKDRIHQCWIIGTRGLSEKKIAMWVNKSTQKYYELSSNTADHIEILVSEENPKLLKSLREELSLNINLAQNSIHQLLHHMGSSQEIAKTNYLPNFKEVVITKEEKIRPKEYIIEQDSLNDIRLDDRDDDGIINELKSMFKSSKEKDMKLSILASILPLFIVLMAGAFYYFQNKSLQSKIEDISTQISAVNKSISLADMTQNIFSAVGKNGEVKKILLNLDSLYVEGDAWGIPKLEANLKRLYRNGKFTIKTGNGFSSIFIFSSK
jgi:hypothetical protein